MKKVIVASKNPVKIDSVSNAFEKVFPDEEFEVKGVSVDSGVPDQPKSNEETYKGALNRANNSLNEYSSADYWVGIEGGIEESKQGMKCFAWVVIKSKEKEGKGKTVEFFLPKKVQKLVKEGLELGDANDKVFDKSNSKQKNGAIGLLTKNLITRTTLYEPAVVSALIPFISPDLY